MKVYKTQDFEEQDEASFRRDIVFNESFRFHMLNIGFNAEMLCDSSKEATK